MLCAGDIVIMSETEGLKRGLVLLESYCGRWKLTVNSTNTKVVIFRTGGRISWNTRFVYTGNGHEIVNSFSY